MFHFETLGEPEKGIEIAKTAFDDALGDLAHLDETQYKDSTLIMQLIRDNMTLWQDTLNLATAADIVSCAKKNGASGSGGPSNILTKCCATQEADQSRLK